MLKSQAFVIIPVFTVETYQLPENLTIYGSIYEKQMTWRKIYSTICS